MSCDLHAYSSRPEYESLDSSVRIKIYVCLANGCGALKVEWIKEKVEVALEADPDNWRDTLWKSVPK